MRVTGKQLVKAYRSMRTMRKCGARKQRLFTARQIPGLLRLYASTHGGHGRSIGKGAHS